MRAGSKVRVHELVVPTRVHGGTWTETEKSLSSNPPITDRHTDLAHTVAEFILWNKMRPEDLLKEAHLEKTKVGMRRGGQKEEE